MTTPEDEYWRQLAAESRSADRAMKWSVRASGCLVWIYILLGLVLLALCGGAAWAVFR